MTIKGGILRRAWEIYRELQGDHLAKLKMALQEAWEEFKRAIHFARRRANKGYLLEMAEVVKETEKAILVKTDACRFGSSWFKWNFWVPKSQVKNGVIPQWIISRVELENNLTLL